MNKIFKIIAFICVLSGCGFKPLYYKDNIAHNDIFIKPIPDFLGQQLRFELRDKLSPAGFPKNPTYYLEVKLEKKLLEKQAFRSDATATRNTMQLTAKFSLIKDGEIIFKDIAYSRSSYDILKNPYATLSSQKDSEKNMIILLAEKIALRVDVFLKNDARNIEHEKEK
ncbi:MAG: hypothetical protein BWY78_00421 [Alphaproteobacteria bacterium ADurb.Bin438]|nr:MAG: hypothetical protein BWY78_00421 [Alphaproteobacteria bacterium ADurb.Bin438]